MNPVLVLEEALFWCRVATSISFLIYASWSDLKTREVSNSVWIVFAPLVFVLTFTQYLFFPPVGTVIQSMLQYGISITFTTVFSLLLFYLGAFGGADAKALICISLGLPLSPDLIDPVSGFVSPVFPITIFSNSVIIAAFSVFYALFRNILWRQKTGRRLFEDHEDDSLGRKIAALLCGYKVPITQLKESFLYPLEDLKTNQQGETRKKLLLFPKDESREEIVERIIDANQKGQISNAVWATPGLPMLVFITVGLLVSLTLGDLVWIIISQLM